MNSKTIRYPLSVIRYGFTLVELLVVIAIIGVLASLITVAVTAARQYVRASIVRMEMFQYDLAFSQYTSASVGGSSSVTGGELPPDFFDDEAVVRHVKKRWPRFVFPTQPVSWTGTLTEFQAACIRQAIRNVYNSIGYDGVRSDWFGGYDVTLNQGVNSVDIASTARAASFAFWVGGFPDPKDGKFRGFDVDPVAPFGRRYDIPANPSNPVNWPISPGNLVNNINDGRNLEDEYPSSTAYSVKDVVGKFDPSAKTAYEMEVGKNVFFVKVRTPSQIIAFPCLVSKAGSDIVPLVYFRGKPGSEANAYAFYDWSLPLANRQWLPKYIDFGSVIDPPGWSEIGYAAPYARSGDPFGVLSRPVWYESERYQLIHPGLDGKFGRKVKPLDSDDNQSPWNAYQYTPGSSTNPYPHPFNSSLFKTTNDSAAENQLGQQDMDNIVNFGEGTIKSLLP